jgi:hypothetical protein
MLNLFTQVLRDECEALGIEMPKGLFQKQVPSSSGESMDQAINLEASANVIDLTGCPMKPKVFCPISLNSCI